MSKIISLRHSSLVYKQIIFESSENTTGMENVTAWNKLKKPDLQVSSRGSDQNSNASRRKSK